MVVDHLIENTKCNEPSMAMTLVPGKDEKAEAERKMKDLKARTILMNTVSDKHLKYISDSETAYETIRKFHEMYSRQSTAIQIICSLKLRRLI